MYPLPLPTPNVLPRVIERTLPATGFTLSILAFLAILFIFVGLVILRHLTVEIDDDTRR